MSNLLAGALSAVPLGTPPDNLESNSRGVELAFTLACAGVVVVGLIMMLLHWRRAGSAFGLMVLIGGMLACIQEPMVDTLGNMYIPPSHFTVFTTYGREMPLFAPFGYGLYFGIPMFLYIRAAQQRAGLGHFQKLFLGSLALELAFEITAVKGDFYDYYDEQPFRFFELPVHWMTLNMAAAWVAAAAVYKALPYLPGWRIVAVVPITVCMITANYYMQGFPIFSAMHAEDPSRGLLVVSSLLTIVLGVAIMQVMIRILCTPNRGESASDITASRERTAVGT